MPQTTPLHNELNTAIIAAQAAGEIIREYYFQKNFTVETKADQSPVTQADKEAEAIIIQILSRAFPGDGFLGEETGAQSGSGQDSKNRRWIIDPLDGTKNFVRHIPVLATLIALEEEGEVKVGVMHNPITHELFFASRGGGAFRNWHRIRVSERKTFETSWLIHSTLHKILKSEYRSGFLNIAEHTERQRGFGDYSGYALVAEGKAEIYIDAPGVKPWDIAAPSVIVEEAGGKFSNFDGTKSLDAGTAVVTNGALHEEVLNMLKTRSS